MMLAKELHIIGNVQKKQIQTQKAGWWLPRGPGCRASKGWLLLSLATRKEPYLELVSNKAESPEPQAEPQMSCSTDPDS